MSRTNEEDFRQWLRLYNNFGGCNNVKLRKVRLELENVDKFDKYIEFTVEKYDGFIFYYLPERDYEGMNVIDEYNRIEVVYWDFVSETNSKVVFVKSVRPSRKKKLLCCF